MRNRSSTGWPRIDLTERRQERWISRTSRSSSAPGVGKTDHWATALSRDGRKVLDKPLPNDEARLRSLYGKLADHGNLLVVVDQPATIGALAVAAAQNMGITMTTCALTSSVGPTINVNATKASALNQAVLALAYRRLTHRIGAPSTAVQC